MRAALFRGPQSIDVGDRPDPVIIEPTDAGRSVSGPGRDGVRAEMGS
jgi:hypothetical protein